MSDWKKQLQGYKDKQGNRNQPHQGKRDKNDMGYQRYTTPGLPDGYLSKGYFDDQGCLLEILLTETASKIAKSFGSNMNNSQLRRFYGHAKTAEKSYAFSGDERKFINDIKALDSFVAEAKGKDKVPQIFYDFINVNVAKANSLKDIKQGFLPHFQAVVAYFTYHYPKSK
ncbi:CRISPR-associated protein, Csm2 family [Desulforamulus reducens MI-1]|uniref:CRISPR system Cms protein Csm2 n=1 Tax=Desulforamulus reducens (strain ATCC BAA-1160 / DSM 100696 / MI-1) TaxID=349161 RepID=A4J503_DESRM|nr:type III-A CRISPR-associated protein Csm2 [Desulforamulus reducens]ABO50156.1 CRISPR-associated protein, Csm2 family [Desulforamulus reducens MI-1]